MVEPHVLRLALRYGKKVCLCQRCGKQLFVDSCGTFWWDKTKCEQVGVCMKCEQDHEGESYG